MVINLDIPDGVKCLLKENQDVDFATLLFERRTESLKTINVAKRLNIEASKIFHHLKKLVGEEVKKGEALAVKKGLFSTLSVESDVDGVIKEINHNSGEVIMTTTGHDKKIQKSYFAGRVKKIENHKIRLEVKDADEFPLKAASADFGGPTYYLKNDLSDEVGNKVVVAKELSPFLQTKAEALGVIGLVTLNKLEEAPDINFAQIKNIADVEKIQKLSFSYCLIDKKNSKIILYENE